MIVRRGMTLVEVVCAIALLSTLLVGMLVAHARHIRQIEKARFVLEGTQLADRFLAEAFLEDRVFEIGESGSLAMPEYRWEIRPSRTPNAFPESTVIAFGVFRTSGSSTRLPVFETEMLVSNDELDPTPQLTGGDRGQQ